MENLETKDVLKQIESTFKEMTKGFALDAEIKAEIASLKDEYKAIKADTTTPDALAKLESIMQEQGMVLTSLKAAKPSLEADAPFIDRVKNVLESNAEGLQGFKEKKAPFVMEFKVGTMLISGNVTGSTTLLPTPVMTAGYNPARRNPTTFLDITPIGTTTSARVAYVDQVSPDGTAATVAEGAGKPQIDADYKVSYSSAVKVAAYTKVSDEMLDDIDFMSKAISDELVSRVRLALSGNIYTYITSGMTPGYTQVHADFVDYFALARQATTWDVINAAKATIEIGNHVANTVLVSPSMYATLFMTKSSTGEYTQPILVTPTAMQFNGMNIISTTALSGDAFIVCDITKLNILMYKDMIVEAGWETADFINNLRTFRGEVRAHYYVKDNDKTAFLFGDFSVEVLRMTAVA